LDPHFKIAGVRIRNVNQPPAAISREAALEIGAHHYASLLWRCIGLTVLFLSIYSINYAGSPTEYSKHLTIIAGRNLKIEQALEQAINSYRLEKDDLILRSEYCLPGSGRRVYQQHYKEIPVIGGSLVIKHTSEGFVRTIYSTLTAWKFELTPVFHLDGRTAIEVATDFIRPVALFANPTADRGLLPLDGFPHPVWRIDFAVRQPPADWEIVVDAVTGKAIRVEDRLAHFDAIGLVFDPDPKSALQTDTLHDEDDAAEAIPSEAYSEVVLTDLEQDDEDYYILRNPFVDATRSPQAARLESPEFIFNRSDPRFEQVMGMFHIDRQARYIARLGYAELAPRPQQIVANGIDADMSFFSPITSLITTGSGGVDDGEDADVWIHEYTHAWLEGLLPRWRGGNTPLLSEGLCDYFAGDASLAAAPGFQPDWIYNWDGHNDFWDGRILNADYCYPDDARRERHDAGQLWSALLWAVRRSAQTRDEWNSVVIDHLYALGDSATVPEAALALLEADFSLARGQFRSCIIAECERRGIQPHGWQRPVISHQSLLDTEDIHSERLVTATILSALPLDSASSALIYVLDEQNFDTIYLRYDERNSIWQAALPAPNQEGWVSYYLMAADTYNIVTRHPFEAPDECHRFFVGPDRIPPHFVATDSLPDSPFPEGEILVGARTVDNIAVAEVWIHCYRRDMELVGAARLRPQPHDSTFFIGRLSWLAAMDQTLRYNWMAVDASQARNAFRSGFGAFTIRPEALIDGFEFGVRRWRLEGWYCDSTDARTGRRSLHDRAIDNPTVPRQALAMLDENWFLAGFGRARLTFWERHSFDIEAGEYGAVEISLNNGQDWIELQRCEGKQDWWEQCAVVLDDFSRDNSPPTRLRWRTSTPQEAVEMSGWFIDDVRLAVGNLVETEKADFQNIEIRPVLYPNPTNGGLNIVYNDAQLDLRMVGQVKIFDLNGRLVQHTEKLSNDRAFAFDLSDLPTGIYITHINVGGYNFRQKVVLMK